MDEFDVLLPGIVLVLAFGLKLLINRDINAPNFIQAISELPVDIIFLTMSFFIAFTIYDPRNGKEGLFLILCSLIAAILIIAIWRSSLTFYSKGKKYLWLVFLAINFFISCVALKESVSHIIHKAKEENIASHKNQSTKTLVDENR